MYFICHKLIAPSDLIRDLGITYDSKLCFHDHINEIVGRQFVGSRQLVVVIFSEREDPIYSYIKHKYTITPVETTPTK